MDRWKTEEALHGELLNRFLGELGLEEGVDWKQQVRDAVAADQYINKQIERLPGFQNFTRVRDRIGEIALQVGQ